MAKLSEDMYILISKILVQFMSYLRMYFTDRSILYKLCISLCNVRKRILYILVSLRHHKTSPTQYYGCYIFINKLKYVDWFFWHISSYDILLNIDVLHYNSFRRYDQQKYSEYTKMLYLILLRCFSTDSYHFYFLLCIIESNI